MSKIIHCRMFYVKMWINSKYACTMVGTIFAGSLTLGNNFTDQGSVDGCCNSTYNNDDGNMNTSH